MGGVKKHASSEWFCFDLVWSLPMSAKGTILSKTAGQS